MMVLMKTEILVFNNNDIEGNEDLMLVILNRTLLHNQNHGWTVPYPCFMICCKNFILKSLHCLIEIVV